MKAKSLAIDYTGFTQIAYHPDTLEWIAPAQITEDYPRLATWSVDGYIDDETGEVVGGY